MTRLLDYLTTYGITEQVIRDYFSVLYAYDEDDEDASEFFNIDNYLDTELLVIGYLHDNTIEDLIEEIKW